MGSLLLLDVLRDELLVLLLLSLGILVFALSLLLAETLSAEPLLSDESLDLGGLVESFLFFVAISILDCLLDGAMDNILANIVLLFVKIEIFPDVIGSLLSELVGPVDVGDLVDVLLTLLEHAECDDGKIWTTDASADGSSPSHTNSAWLVTSSTLLVKDAGPAVDHDPLLHHEALLVISACDFEHIALVVIAHDCTVNLLAHPSIEEGTNVFFIINFNSGLAASGGVRDVELHRRCTSSHL